MTVFEMNNAAESALHPKMDKYVIYLRKSREDLKAEARGEGETLARHRKILTDHAARRGLYVEKIYEEIVSGETIEARPQIQQLINECYEGKYKGVLVVEVSRLSRGNQGDAQIILDCLKFGNHNSGVLVITPTKTYDVAHNSDDEEYMEFELFMSRREYKMITKRLQRGREQAVVEGNYIGAHRPYGYDIYETPTARTLKENPVEGPIVRKIFEWKVNKNMTPGEIAKKLTMQGVITYTGAREWARDTIKVILKNPVYYGKVRWYSRMKIKQMKDGKLVKIKQDTVGTEHYMEYEGKHSGIISEEMFKAAQQGLQSDKTKTAFILKNPLAGLLYCQKCQRAMRYNDHTDSKKNVKPRFAHTTSQICKVKSAYASDVLDAFIHGLKMYLENFETMIDNKPEVDENDIQNQIHSLELEKKKIDRTLSKIFDDYEDGVYTANEFVQRKAKHNARLEAIDKEIAELESAIPEREEYQEKIYMLHEAIEMLKDDSISAETKNIYLKQFVQKIEFSREETGEFVLDICLY